MDWSGLGLGKVEKWIGVDWDWIKWIKWIGVDCDWIKWIKWIGLDWRKMDWIGLDKIQ